MNHEVSNFEKEVLERSKTVPVLVDFWAPWCAPCRALGPVLERLATQANGRWELVKVNTEEHQDLATFFEIASIPAVKLFINGKAAHEFVGALPEREILRFLEKALPSPGANQLAEAKRLLDEGSGARAAELLEKTLAADPRNFEARILLAQTLLSTEPQRVAALLEPVGPDSDFSEKAHALRTLGGLAELADQPAAAPQAKVRERYLEGAAAVKSGNFARALEAFIDVLGRNKEYQNGAAREACKAIFQLLGARHPLVERSFRAFSSALHS